VRAIYTARFIYIINCNSSGVSAVLLPNLNRHACLLLIPVLIHVLALEGAGIPAHYLVIQALALRARSPPNFLVIVVIKRCHSNVLTSPQVNLVPHLSTCLVEISVGRNWIVRIMSVRGYVMKSNVGSARLEKR
jgi:hypothetical protein